MVRYRLWQLGSGVTVCSRQAPRTMHAIHSKHLALLMCVHSVSTNSHALLHLLFPCQQSVYVWQESTPVGTGCVWVRANASTLRPSWQQLAGLLPLQDKERALAAATATCNGRESDSSGKCASLSPVGSHNNLSAESAHGTVLSADMAWVWL